jgi:Xaa-Pro dipeptidase
MQTDSNTYFHVEREYLFNPSPSFRSTVFESHLLRRNFRGQKGKYYFGGHQTVQLVVSLSREKNVMQTEGLDALIALSPENVSYGIGCVIPSQFFVRRRHAISVFPLKEPPTLITADMEEEHAKKFSSVRDIRSYPEFLVDPIDLVADVIKEKKLEKGRLGIELQYIPASDFEKLKTRLPKAEFVGCDEYLEELYSVKNERQTSLLRKIAFAAENAIREGFETIRPGMTEHELARIMINRFYKDGGDGVRILTVGSGERSSLPNVGPSDKAIKKGDLIRVDFLGLKEYYMSDVCRTAVVGKATDEHQETWSKLVKTEHAMLDIIKPGIKACDVYSAYLKTWKEFGFKPIRFIGHGLGLSAHERPFLSDFDKLELQEGMILCVEPLLLIPGFGGYHVEDEILVTKEGSEIITNRMDTSSLFEIR